jgi:hypothetical protein
MPSNKVSRTAARIQDDETLTRGGILDKLADFARRNHTDLGQGRVIGQDCDREPTNSDHSEKRNTLHLPSSFHVKWSIRDLESGPRSRRAPSIRPRRPIENRETRNEKR